MRRLRALHFRLRVVAWSNSLLDFNKETVLQNTTAVKWTTHFFAHKHSVGRASAKQANHQRNEMGNPIFCVFGLRTSIVAKHLEVK